jgi:aminopeptidase N
MNAPEQPKAIHLSEYRPPSFEIQATNLVFDIRDGETTVENRMRLIRREPEVPLVLDGQELTLSRVEVDGRTLSSNEYRVDDHRLSLFGIPDECEVCVVTRIHPERNTALEGLYRSSSLYCTQCEAEGFRKITYYLDRPDVLSVFTTTIIADSEHPVLLSNGNLIASETTADGRRRVTWNDPFPKPSYLFALVAGDLALLEDRFVTVSGREVMLRIYSEPHNIGQCGYAMDALKRAMRWDEQAYGREYDLDIFMIVAVDDFNMGAMENKGLNIFNTSCVLATPDTATDQAYQRVEAVVAHEYFHNWSGNRVTCRDWFQLSLKEGFTVFRDAQFSAAMNSPTVKRIEDVNVLRSVQFAEDAGPLAHPVRPDSYIEISNFYTPTVYEKGAEVVRMVQTIVGEDSFRAGSDLYFERHDGQAVTTEDFLAAMQDASGADLSQFQRWYDQAGTPVLVVTGRIQADRFELLLAQRCPATPGAPDKAPFHMPVAIGLLDRSGRSLVDGQLRWHSDSEIERRGDSLLVQFKSAETTIVFPELSERPEVSLLRGFSAPVKTAFERPDASRCFLAVADPDGFASWDALQELLVAEVERIGEGEAPSAEVEGVFEALLDRALADRARSAEDDFLIDAKLGLPSENYLFEQVERIDVERICGARDKLLEHLAVSFTGRWRQLLESCDSSQAYSVDAASMARRSLRNTALRFLEHALDGEELETLLEALYSKADNLTDRRAVLSVAVNGLSGSAFTAALLDGFYERWQAEALVVNQWFAVQASGVGCSVTELGKLLDHPAFSLTNPNKVRSVLTTFAALNQRNFHAADGSAYRFIGERIVELDGINPQMAAGLAKPLTRWRRYTLDRGRRMQEVLRGLAAREGLSTDLFEIVSKSLA